MGPKEVQSIGIVLADDHALVRSAIGALLSCISGVKLLGEARDGVELLRIVEAVQPDIVITDLSMPGMDGYTAAARIKSEFPDVRVVALSAQHSVEAVKRAVASGACGYLRKDAPIFELELTIRGVMNCGTYFGSDIVQLLLQPTPLSAKELLTERQFEVLIGLAQGKSTKEIGSELGLSSKTVDVHRARIMARLNINDIASLTRLAIRAGLLKN